MTTETIIDNTTVFGAGRAIKTYPDKVSDWKVGANAANLRALSDLIESIILYETILIDAVSRAVLSDYGEIEFQPSWSALFKKKTGLGKGTIVDVSFWHAIGPNLTIEAARASIKDLMKKIDDGTLREQVTELDLRNNVSAFPDYYSSGESFKEMFLNSLPLVPKDDAVYIKKKRIKILADPEIVHSDFELSRNKWWMSNTLLSTTMEGDWNFDEKIFRDIKNVAKKIDDILDEDPILASYAMFAFRGYYYFHLSNYLSMSYRPHSWRSMLIDDLIKSRQIDFTDFTAEKIGSIRKKLVTNLNKEFLNDQLSLDFPPISSFVLGQCSKRKSILKTAAEIRNTNEVKEFRAWAAEIQELIKDQKDLPKLEKAFRTLDGIVNDISSSFKMNKGEKEKMKLKISVPFLSLEIPLLKDIPRPRWVYQVASRSTHFTWLKEIGQQSLHLPTLSSQLHHLD